MQTDVSRLLRMQAALARVDELEASMFTDADRESLSRSFDLPVLIDQESAEKIDRFTAELAVENRTLDRLRASWWDRFCADPDPAQDGGAPWP